MQTYPLSLTPANPGRVIAAQGDLFVYESAEAAPRTNLLGNSEQFDAWLKVVATITANAVSGPDGGTTADKIVGTGNYWWTQQGVTVVPGTEYTASIWLKAPVAGPMKIFLNDSTGTLIQNLVCDVTTDWKRFTITATARDATMYFRVGYDVPKEAHLFGAMLERSSSMGAYVPSSGPGPGYGPGELRIRVQPDTGGDIVLRPGQRFRSAEPVTNWTVKAIGNESLDASVIIGSGEFDDANTKNVFKLDATFANQVTVTNTADAPVRAAAVITNTEANRVPVALDVNVPLSIAGSTVAYTQSWASDDPTAGKVEILAPGANPNGAYVEVATIYLQMGITNSPQTGSIALIAKASVPATRVDGDVLMYNAGTISTTQPYQQKEVMPNRIRVAPGKGLYMVTEGYVSQCRKTVLLTVI